MPASKRRPEPVGEETPADSALGQLAGSLLAGDPAAFARCFTPAGVLRVPQPEGDLVLRGRDQIADACRKMLAAFTGIGYSAARRYVMAGEVIEEAILEGTLAGIPADPEAQTPAIPARPVRVGVRISALISVSGELARAVAWLDLPTLRAQLGVADRAGAAGTVVAALRGAEARNLQVIEVTPDPVVEPQAAAEVDEAEGQGRRRRTGIGAVLALTVGLLLVALLVAGVITRGFGRNLPGTATGPTTGASPTAGASGGATTRPSPTASGPVASKSKLPVVVTQPSNVAPTVQQGHAYTLRTDLLFALNSSVLTANAQQAIAGLAQNIREHKVHGNIQVNGYTDNVGTDAYNRQLSKDRARAVADALQTYLGGLDVQLQVQAFGESSPAFPNDTPAHQAANRRVTVVLPQV